MRVAWGPATIQEKSQTRIPSSGRGGSGGMSAPGRLLSGAELDEDAAGHGDCFGGSLWL